MKGIFGEFAKQNSKMKEKIYSIVGKAFPFTSLKPKKTFTEIFRSETRLTEQNMNKQQSFA